MLHSLRRKRRCSRIDHSTSRRKPPQLYRFSRDLSIKFNFPALRECGRYRPRSRKLCQHSGEKLSFRPSTFKLNGPSAKTKKKYINEEQRASKRFARFRSHAVKAIRAGMQYPLGYMKRGPPRPLSLHEHLSRQSTEGSLSSGPITFL